MSKQYKHNKAFKEPLYYRGNKAAKQYNHGYHDYSGLSAFFEKCNDNPKDKKKHKYRKTYKTIIEYEKDYDSDTGNEKYGYDFYSQPKYKKDDKKSNYSSEGDLHQRKHPYMSRYQPSKSRTVIDYDSDSEFSQRKTPRGSRESLYSYQEQYSKDSNFLKGQRRHSRGTIDTERSYYQRDEDVYAAELPTSRNPYRYKQRKSKLSDDNNNEAYTKDQKSRKRYPQETIDTEMNHYQRNVDVYAAELPTGQNPYRYKQKESKLSDDNNNNKAYAKYQKSRKRHQRETTDTERNHCQRNVDVYAAELPKYHNTYEEKRKKSNLSDDNNDEASLKGQRRHPRDTTDTERRYYQKDVDVYAAELPRGQNPYRDKWIESKLSEDNNDKANLKGQRRHSRDTTDTEKRNYQKNVDLYAAELPRGQNPYRDKWIESKLSEDNNDKAYLKGQRRHSRDTTDTEKRNYQKNVDLYAAELPRGQNPYRDKWIESKLSEDNNDKAYLKGQRRHSRDTTDTEKRNYQKNLDVYAAELPRGQNPYKDKWKESKLSDDTNDETSLKGQRRDTTCTELSPLNEIYKYNPDTFVNSSEFAHISVIFQDEPNKQKSNSSKLKLKDPKDEEPLKNNIGVFVASNLEPENIFQQSHNAKYKELSSSIKEETNVSTAIQCSISNTSKLGVHDNEYPVKKSSINVTSNQKSPVKYKSPALFFKFKNALNVLKARKGYKCSISASNEKNQGSDRTIEKDKKESMVQIYTQTDFTQDKNKNQDGSSVIYHVFDVKQSLPNISYSDQNHNKQTQTTGILQDQSKSEVDDNFKTSPGAKRESPNNCQNSKSKQEVPTSVIADQKIHSVDIHHKCIIGSNDKKNQHVEVKTKSGGKKSKYIRKEPKNCSNCM